MQPCFFSIGWCPHRPNYLFYRGCLIINFGPHSRNNISQNRHFSIGWWGHQPVVCRFKSCKSQSVFKTIDDFSLSVGGLTNRNRLLTFSSCRCGHQPVVLIETYFLYRLVSSPTEIYIFENITIRLIYLNLTWMKNTDCVFSTQTAL